MNTSGGRSQAKLRLWLASACLGALWGCGADPSGVRLEELLVSVSSEQVHWEYEGPLGPEHWGDLDPSFAACSQGRRQSPIDLANPRRSHLPSLRVNYGESEFSILNNGHTIQVNYDPGSFLEIGRKRYQLLQYHFHRPSEHTVDGVRFPLELHLVHQDAKGELAVLGVLIAEGSHNPAFHPLWDNLPAEEGEHHLAVVHNAEDMLRGSGDQGDGGDDERDDESDGDDDADGDELKVYRYAGSLTTPPCTEGVRWNVLAMPVAMSAEQLEAFAGIFELNSRPLQLLNRRIIRLDDSDG